MKTRCESIETTISKRQLLFAGGGVRQSEGQLLVPSRAMFSTITGGEGPDAGRTIEDLSQRLEATEGSTEHSPFYLELFPTMPLIAAKKAGEWNRGVFKAAERFLVRWHEDEAKLCRGATHPLFGWRPSREW